MIIKIPPLFSLHLFFDLKFYCWACEYDVSYIKVILFEALQPKPNKPGSPKNIISW